MTTTRLRGIEAIKAYTEHGWETISKWIENEGFPARLMGHRWTSDKRLIDDWFCERLKAEKEPS